MVRVANVADSAEVDPVIVPIARKPAVVAVDVVTNPSSVDLPSPAPVPAEVLVRAPIEVVAPNAALEHEKSKRVAGDNDLRSQIAGLDQKIGDYAAAATAYADQAAGAAQNEIGASLDDKIDAEKQAREDANAALQSAQDTLQAAHDALSQALTDEETARAGAKQTLQTAIDAETSARTDAIAAEQAARAQLASDTQASLAQTNAAIEQARTDSDAALTQAKGELQTAIDAVQASSDGVAASVQSEATARQDADSAETTARQQAIAGVQTDVQTNATAITAERDARVSAISAETTARETAISGVQSDIADVNAALTAEQTTRADADTAETNARTAAVSNLQGQIDTTNAAITAEAQTRADADSAETNARTAAISSLQGQIDTTTAAIAAEQQTRADADSAETSARTSAVSSLQGQIDTANGRIDDANAALTTEQQTRATADTAETNARTAAVSSLQGQIDSANAAITAEQNTRATADTAETNARTAAISDLQGQINDATAAITAEQNTRATNDTAETNARTAAVSSLQGQIDTANAAITAEQSTRATNDATETSQRQADVSSLQGQINSANAAITSEANTRATADSAETAARQSQVSQLSTPGGSLVDPLFSRSTPDAALAWGWSDWAWGTTLVHTRTGGKIGPNCVEILDDARSTNVGMQIASDWAVQWPGPSHATNRYFVVEIDFEYVSGDLRGAGFLLYGLDNDTGTTTNWSRKNFVDVTGPSPQTGRLYSMRQFIDGYSSHVPANPAHCITIFHLFGGWDTLYADLNISGPLAKTVRIHRANVRAATQSEIETGTASGAISTAITAAINAEASTRASADTAETNARTSAISSLQGQINDATAAIASEASTRATADTAETNARTSAISSLQGQIDSANAAIVTEQQTRADADSSEASARLTLSSTLSATLGPVQTWTQGTAPTFDQMFPPGVQACPVGNLTELGTLQAWSNSGRGYDAAALDLGGWTLEGGHTVWTHLAGAWSASSTYECFQIGYFTDQPIPVVPGAAYEFSVYTGIHRARGFAMLAFLDASGTFIGEWPSIPGGPVVATLGGVNDGEASGGTALSGYKRLGLIVTAPANAAFVIAIVRADNQGLSSVGQSDPYIFVTRPFFSRAKSGQTTFTDWKPFQRPVWTNTADANKFYVWKGYGGTGFELRNDTRIDTNTTNISQLFSTTNGISAMWGVQIDTNGKLIGRVQLNGSGGTSSFDVLATSFTVSMPGYSNPIFEVGNVNGSPKITLRADVVQDDSLNDGQIGSINLNDPTFASGTGSASLTVTLRGGKPIALIAKSSGYGNSSAIVGAKLSIVQGSTTIAFEAPQATAYTSGGATAYAYSPVILLASFTPPSDGDYTIVAQCTPSTGLNKYLPATSLLIVRPYK